MYCEKTSDKTTHFQTRLEIGNPKEDGKQEKEKLFSYPSQIPEDNAWLRTFGHSYSTMVLLANGASFQDRLILLGLLEAFTVKEGMQSFSSSQLDTKHRLYVPCCLYLRSP